MPNSNTIQLTLTVKDDGNVVIDQAAGEIEKFGKRSQSAAQTANSGWAALKSSWMELVAVAYSFKKVIDLYNEHDQAVRLMNLTFRDNAGQMIQKAKEISAATKNLFSGEEIMTSMSSYASEMQRYGIEGLNYINMISTATDIAAARNKTLAETMGTLEAAMKGNARGASDLGLTLSDTYMQEVAFNGALKDVWSSLSETQQVQYRYIEMMKQAAQYQGEASQGADDFDKRITRLGNSLKDLLLPILNILVPILSKVAEGWGMIINSISALTGGLLSKLFEGLSWVYSKLENIPKWVPFSKTISNWAGSLKDLTSDWSKGFADFGMTGADNLMNQLEQYASKTSAAPKITGGSIPAPVTVVDEKKLQESLSQYQDYYNQLVQMAKEAAEQVKKSNDEILKLEQGRADMRQSTWEMIDGLRKNEMTEEEKYVTDFANLQDRYDMAMSMQGQSRIEALEKIKQSAASLTSTYGSYVEEQYGKGTHDAFIQTTIDNIMFVAKKQDAAYAEMIEAEKKRAAAGKEASRQIQETIIQIEQEIERLNAQTKKPLELKIQTEDTLSQIHLIQQELAKIQSKTITVTVIHEGYGSTKKPLTEKIQEIIDKYGALPQSMVFTGDFTDVTSRMNEVQKKINEVNAYYDAWHKQYDAYYHAGASSGPETWTYTERAKALYPLQTEMADLKSLYQSYQSQQAAASSNGGSVSGGSGINLNIGPVTISVGSGVGADRDLAVTLASEFDKEVAGLIIHRRSQIPAALESVQ